MERLGISKGSRQRLSGIDTESGSSTDRLENGSDISSGQSSGTRTLRFRAPGMAKGSSAARGSPWARLASLFREHPVLTAVVAIPLLLVAVALLAAPADLASRARPLPHPRLGVVERASRYAVVLDAGSTGTRVHTYRFSRMGDGDLEFESDDFHSITPGLSAYAGDPAQAAASLDGLLQKAAAAVPPELHGETTVELRATAGLRLLEGTQAEDILAAVRARLRRSGFDFDDSMVSVLDGQDEAVYAWMALNYLQGKLGAPPAETSATIDLGGGSVQLAYAMEDWEAAMAPQGYVRVMQGAGRSYHVYVHSWLGYGLMAGRAQVLSTLLGLRGLGAAQGDGGGGQPAGAERSRALQEDGTREGGQHPCMARGPATEYVYSGVRYPLVAGPTGPDLSRCQEVSRQSLAADRQCLVVSTPLAHCLFAGAWGGPWARGGHPTRNVHLMSYFFDRAIEAGIVERGSLQARSKPRAYLDLARQVCERDTGEEVVALLGSSHVDASKGQFFCMDLVYQYEMMVEGFQIDPDQDVTLIRQISYRVEPVEVTWPLGAAIQSLAAQS